MKHLKDIQTLEGVKVLLRVDFNVPVTNGVVMDDYRMRRILPTLAYLKEKKAQVILMSHIEAAGAKRGAKPSLEPVCAHLKKLGVACVFIKDYKKVSSTDGNVLLLENLRMYEGEEKNDKKFAKELASLGDIYVNEAFAVSHRAHASVSAITGYMPSYAGLLFEQEIAHLSSAFKPNHPFLFILCGAKFETKLPLIEKFMGIADKVFVGGALANNFFKEEGKDIGKSLVSPENFNLARFIGNPKLLLPVDSIIKDNAIYDAGPETMKMLEKEINAAKYILWNGPLGAYEMGYKQPTLDLARMIADATAKGATSILGGGDTLGALAELKIEEKFTFVSTGGGAMLEYLAKGTLPGLEALEKSAV
jgi:3-phosphoglycerate kinase